jgi:peptidyl-prolyl cis-trans isomerase C
MKGPPVIASRASLPLCLLGLLSACGNRDVLAHVGSEKLRKVDLDAFQGNGRGRGDSRAALEGLAERAMLAEASRRAGLEKDPVVQARIRAAAREILAQAFLEKELAGAGREDLLRKRYLEQKDTLAHKQIHVAQIAVHVKGHDASAKSEAESRVSHLYARLMAGEPFDKVAKDGSDDPVSGARGGDLGPILEGQVDETFFAQAAALKRGQVGKPFETSFGFHVVKALEDPAMVTPSFDEARGVLAAEARTAAERQLSARWHEKISVEVHAERLAEQDRPATKPVGGR